MAIHNHTLLGSDPELLEYFVAKPRLMDQAKIGILGFVMRALVRNEVALEGGDAVLAEQRRLRPAPQVPQQVQVFSARPWLLFDQPIYGPFDGVKKRFALVRSPLHKHR